MSYYICDLEDDAKRIDQEDCDKLERKLRYEVILYRIGNDQYA